MSSNFCYEYFRMHQNVLTLGGMRWTVRGEEVGITDDTKINPVIAEKLRAYLREHFPDLAEIDIDREWTGIMAGTADGLPLLGEIPGHHGELLCLGFNGYGMSFAFLAGKCMCEMVMAGRAADPALKLFDPRRLDDDNRLLSPFTSKSR